MRPTNPSFDDIFPGEPLRPIPNLRRRRVIRFTICVLLAAVGTWGWYAGADSWASSIGAAVKAQAEGLYAALVQKPPAGTSATETQSGSARETAGLVPPLSPLPSPPEEIANMPPKPPLTTASIQPVAPPAPEPLAAEPLAAPLPPPVIDPKDPYQKRALAAGLHPDLSRVLLSRLSAADYKNAGIAIQTALTETAGTDTYVWPRQRKPELALFEVHFVAGAPPACRRYVVKVTIDGWLTTALPMEKCGLKPVLTAAKAKRE
jgi:hypothetical protein